LTSCGCRNIGLCPADMLSAVFASVCSYSGSAGSKPARRTDCASLCSDPYSLTRCFNSQTRSAARSKALVRARVPAAGSSRVTTFVAPLPLPERVFGLRPFDLVLRMRLAAGVVTVKCPFPFMIRFLSSFQAQAIAGRLVSPASQRESYILGFQVLKQI